MYDVVGWPRLWVCQDAAKITKHKKARNAQDRGIPICDVPGVFGIQNLLTDGCSCGCASLQQQKKYKKVCELVGLTSEMHNSVWHPKSVGGWP